MSDTMWHSRPVSLLMGMSDMKIICALIITVAIGLSTSVRAQSVSVEMGSVLQILPILPHSTMFTLTNGGLSYVDNCFIFNNGFCWDTQIFKLYKNGTSFNGKVGNIMTMPYDNGCVQYSFQITKGTLVLGKVKTKDVTGWYTQTSCSEPSGFMGGGTLLVNAN